MSDKNGRNETIQVVEDPLTISFPDGVQSPDVACVPEELQSQHDFEEAVQATGYGLFNWLLLLAVLPGVWANFFDTTTMSYVLPSAECDLQLTLVHKGMLNAAVYAGMISSAFVWGFLSDTWGRRSLLMAGYIADSICNILSSMSQSFYVMLGFKFLSGLIISGPFAINMTYVAEFHGSKYRSKVLLCARVFPSLASIVLPGLAWSIIPQPWSFTLFNGAFVYNSWRIFLLVCSIPALLASLTLLYFPESPKFLMTQGRNDEALEVFKRMYSMNTGNPVESFPVSLLRREDQIRKIECMSTRRSTSIWDKSRSGWSQIKPLFMKPYLGQFLLIVTIQFGTLLSLNTLRLWMPQLFTLMDNFDYKNHDASLGSPTLCDMLSAPSYTNATIIDDLDPGLTNSCVVVHVSRKVYINSMIIAATAVMGYALAGNLINLIGQKNLLLVSYAVPAVCCFGLNWSPDSDITLAIVSIYMAFVSISSTTVISFIIELMPTSLRTTALSLTMSLGRSGAMIGNLLFPILLSAGCMVPFVFVGGFLIACAVLSFFIPKPPAKLI